MQNKFFIADKIQTVRDFVDVKLLEGGAEIPLKYHVVSSYPYKKYSEPDQTLQAAGLGTRALLNVEAYTDE